MGKVIDIRTMAERMESLAQADALLVLARLLSPPHPNGLLEVAPADARELARTSGLSERPGADRVLEEALAEAVVTDRIAWADEHRRLFEGGAKCLPYETAYVHRDKEAILADIHGFYGAFGFEIVPEAGEKADHVVTELEFLSMLLVMLARSQEAGDTGAEGVTRAALSSFVHDHVDEWLPFFRERLAEQSSLPLYQKVARLLEDVVEVVIVRHDLPRAR